MKRLIVVLFGLIMFTSCGPGVYREAYQDRSELIELSFNGETHMFVLFECGSCSNGIAHWPGCKYCKH